MTAHACQIPDLVRYSSSFEPMPHYACTHCGRRWAMHDTPRPLDPEPLPVPSLPAIPTFSVGVDEQGTCKGPGCACWKGGGKHG